MRWFRNTLIRALFFGAVVQSVHADSFRPATPIAATSPDGQIVVRILPIDGGNASEVTGYKLKNPEEGYQRAFSFRSKIMPQRAFVCDQGQLLVFIDYYGGSGMSSDVVAFLDTTGNVQKKWALREFYRKEDLSKLSRSTSMIFWKGAMWQLDDSTVVIERPRYKQSDRLLPDYVIGTKKRSIEALETPIDAD